MLDIDPDCPRRPTRALLLSELTTFLTQVETHLGKPAILSPSADFEAEYHVGDAVNRPLWLRSPRREPAADAPAWVIWQANDALSVIGSTGPTRWLVAHDRVTPAPPPGMTTGDEEKSQ
jgi:lysozyme